MKLIPYLIQTKRDKIFLDALASLGLGPENEKSASDSFSFKSFFKFF